MIIVDTREQKNQHILKYFHKNGIEYIEQTVKTGDYASPKSNIIVERKANLLELAGNISKDNAKRIKKEFCRIPKDKKMVILVEENFSCLEEVIQWETPYTNMLGTTMYRYMVSWQCRHNIEYRFCQKAESGRVIAELLGVV